MIGARIGPLVVSTGGLAFALVNSGTLPGPARYAVRALAVLLYLAAIWRTVIRLQPGDGLAPAPDAFRTYWISVVLMLVGFVAGSQLLVDLGKGYLTPIWIAVAVGLHFIPFARAFRAPIFLYLGPAMTLIALGFGAVAVLVGPTDLASTGAAVAGLSMLVAMVCAPLVNSARRQLRTG